MANTLGSVVIEMAVNLARLRSDFGTAAQISQTRLREIERNAARTVREISNVGRAVQNAFGAIGIGIGISTIAYTLKNAASEAIRFGDEMAKAAAKTGVAGSTFSELAYAARQNDVSLESLSKGFKTFQQRVSEAGSGSKTALDVFRALGIQFDDFRSKAPEDQFEILAEQISRLQDPADRTRAAVELFGRAGADLLPLFEQGAQGVRALREEAVRTGRALTDEQITALSDADLAIKNMTASWERFARTLTAAVAPAIAATMQQLNDFVSGSQEGLLRRQIDLLKSLEDRKFGALIVGAGDRIPSGFYSQDRIRQLRQDLEAGLQRRQESVAAPRTPIAGTAAPGFDTTRETRASTKRVQEDLWVLRDQVILSQRAWMELGDTVNKEMDDIGASISRGIERDLSQLSVPVKIATEEWAIYAEQAARNMQDAFAQFLFDPFKEGLRGMLANFVDVIRQMIAQYVAMQAITGLGKFLGGSSNSIVSSFGDFLAGKRAAGGPVTAGSAYLVGEKGPELFLPRSSGMIVPNGGGGAVLNQTVHIDARGADADRIMAILPPLLRQNREQTIADMMRLQRQGRFA